MVTARTTERELKFDGVDHDLLRQRLSSLEAESQGSATLEDNWIFDQNGRLWANGEIVRLRVDRRGARLTYKGPARFDGRAKVRLEHQTGVADVEQMRAILEALGYELVGRYQKYREEWILGSIVIALDHTPIGDFAEFEGEGCERVARRCGLDPEGAERRDYLRLYSDFRREHPDAPAQMVFP